MSNTIVVTQVNNSVLVTEDVNDVVISSVGVQGPAGAQGSSGVVTVNAPLTNAGTSSAANLSISAGTTSTAGALQLTDSVASTSTTTAATPNAVKTAYDIAITKPPTLRPYSGLYIRTPMSGLFVATMAHQTTYYEPIYISKTTTFDRIAIHTQAGHVGSTTVRLGIYNDNDGLPSTVLLDAGTVAPSAANTNYQITISQSLSPGLYWLAFCQQGTAPTTAAYYGAAASGSIGSFMIVQSTTTFGGSLVQGFSQSSVTGAFATAGTLANNFSTPYVWLRAV
jgi:hypothetical protein